MVPLDLFSLTLRLDLYVLFRLETGGTRLARVTLVNGESEGTRFIVRTAHPRWEIPQMATPRIIMLMKLDFGTVLANLLRVVAERTSSTVIGVATEYTELTGTFGRTSFDEVAFDVTVVHV